MYKLAVFILLTYEVCFAQGGGGPLKGEVQAEGDIDLTRLTVLLEKPTTSEPPQSALVGVGGEFEFRGVANGTYTLRVVNANGDELASTSVAVSTVNPPIAVRLPSFHHDRPGGGTISVARLRHKPVKQALRAALKAQKLSVGGKVAEAAGELEKAVELDPEFSEAHGNLGAQYVRLGRNREAAEEFRSAIALDHSTAMYQSNLAIALGRLGEFEEAETWATRAVQLDGTSPLNQYVLGSLMAIHKPTREEGFQHLRIAARDLPLAHQALANLYRQLGNEAKAREELEEYRIATAAPSGAHTPEGWISPLH